MAPDIEVFIASNNIPSSATRRHASKRPTLVFSPGNLLTFVPCAARFMPGCPIPKLEQIARFTGRRTCRCRPARKSRRNLELPEAEFGSHVVVKPGFSESSRGQFITLMRRESVRFQPRESFPEDHPGRYGPMLVQRFIDTGPFVSHHRVLTLFGVPLLAFKTTAKRQGLRSIRPDDVLATMP